MKNLNWSFARGASLVILLLGLVVGLILVNEKQIFKSKATSGGLTLAGYKQAFNKCQGEAGYNIAYDVDNSDGTNCINFRDYKILRSQFGQPVQPTPTSKPMATPTPTPTKAPTPTPPPASTSPTPTVTAANGLSCINNGYDGSGFKIQWAASNPAVTWVDVSTDNFANFYHKWVSGLTETDGTGFYDAYTGYGPLTYYPNTKYYVRTYNGSQLSSTTTATTPVICSTYTPTPTPTKAPTPTPTPPVPTLSLSSGSCMTNNLGSNVRISWTPSSVAVNYVFISSDGFATYYIKGTGAAMSPPIDGTGFTGSSGVTGPPTYVPGVTYSAITYNIANNTLSAASAPATAPALCTTSTPIPTPTPLSTPTPTPTTPPQTDACTACSADVDRSGYVNYLDPIFVKSFCWGKHNYDYDSYGRSCSTADIYNDGIIGQNDLDCVNRMQGAVCTK